MFLCYFFKGSLKKCISVGLVVCMEQPLKVKRVLDISYFLLLVMINCPFRPGTLSGSHFAGSHPSYLCRDHGQISVEILHYLSLTCSWIANVTHTCSWPWFLSIKKK